MTGMKKQNKTTGLITGSTFKSSQVQEQQRNPKMDANSNVCM